MCFSGVLLRENIINGLAMLGSLVMSTVYTNKFTFGQLKLRFEHLLTHDQETAQTL